MKLLSENNIENKRVLLRCDFNVPVKDDAILDNSKIIKSLDTIKYLLDNHNKVIIFSHFGRIKKEEDKKDNSLKIVFNELKNYIDIEFIPNPLNIKEVTNVSSSNCFLVENTRYTDLPKKRESDNDLGLARYWASFGDVFVLDAFASSHRAHSSTAGISKYLPTYLGFLMERELNGLDKLVNNPDRPFIAIMGGAKVDDKTKIIKGLITKCDKLIITGGILNTFLSVAGKNVGNSLISNDEEARSSVKNILDNYSDKLFFTDNFTVLRDNLHINTTIKDIKDNDIIYDNIPSISKIINESKTIFLNGTCGKYEEDGYEEGTVNLLKELSDSNSHVYVGGGDTISAVNKYGFSNAYKYLSSGGGATLEYVSSGKLNALEWIKENGVDSK